MGELSRKREAVEEAARKGEDTWPHWVAYAAELGSCEAEAVRSCIDRCIDTCAESSDHHGAAILRWVDAEIALAVTRAEEG